MPALKYLDDFEALNAAAEQWHTEHPGQRCVFNVPDLRDPGAPILIGGLDLAAPLGLAHNEAARALVAYVDERTERRGTMFMLQVLLTIQLANEVQPNSPGGSA